MAQTTQPTIKWVQCVLNNSGQVTQNDLGNNTVDYQAVQAGQYSNMICVRPQFNDNNTHQIGKIRMWWNSDVATTKPVTSTGDYKLTSNGWIVKYYISMCDSYLPNMQGNNSANASRACASMLRYVNDNELNKNAVTSTRLINASTSISGAQDWCWCKATWQESNDNTKIAMQVVPLNWSDANRQAVTYASAYGQTNNSTFWSQFYGSDGGSSTSTMLSFSVGGTLYSKQCNVSQYVSSNAEFPYIFFAIKAPATVQAGTWGGWNFRLSYIWPYTSASTTSGSST